MKIFRSNFFMHVTLHQIIFSLVTAFLLLYTTIGQASAVVDEQFVGTPPADVRLVPHYGFKANGQRPFADNFNFLFAKNADGQIWNTSKVTEVGICSNLNDSICPKATYIKYFATLGFCESDTSVDCIDRFAAMDALGNQVAVKSKDKFPGARAGDFAGDSRVGLPSGGPAPLVEIPELPHAGGTKYLLVVTAEGSRLADQEMFSPPNIEASIYAVSIESRSMSPPGIFVEKNRYPTLNDTINTYGNPENDSCAIYGSQGCAKKFSLPVNAKFSLKLKLSNPTQGWLHGRIGDVSANVEKTSSGSQVISVSGSPLKLPTVYSWVTKATAPESVKNFYNSAPQPLGGGGYGCTDRPGDAMYACNADKYMSVLRTATPDSSSMQEFLAWLPHLSDQATTAPTIWRFETMRDEEARQGCYQSTKSLSGFVSTNATQYLSGPPVFNVQQQSLDYKVAAPHFLPDGEEFLGTYDLIIRSDVARCLYGFTDAPIVASISVTSPNGDEKIATTKLVEKDGWLNFSAKGFTFSSPTIRVKLTQQKELSPTKISNGETTSKSSAGSQAKQTKMGKSITCVKGGKTRKVLGVKAKCPPGYKKI